MIIPLYPLLNAINLPNGLRFGQQITVANYRTAVIERVMSDRRVRLLVNAGLKFAVPQYVTLTELAALTARPQTADGQSRAAA